jgi:hypothetical protein
MKLLFDQNLSFKLCRTLNDLFPGSIQVGLVGLADATDREVWEYAKINGFMLASLDSDFAEMAALLGPSRPRSSGCGVAINRRPCWRTCFAIRRPRSQALNLMALPPVWRFTDRTQTRSGNSKICIEGTACTLTE